MSDPILFPGAISVEPQFKLMHAGGFFAVVACACDKAIFVLEGIQAVATCPACGQKVGVKSLIYTRDGDDGSLEISIGYVGRIQLAAPILRPVN